MEKMGASAIPMAPKASTCIATKLMFEVTSCRLHRSSGSTRNVTNHILYNVVKNKKYINRHSRQTRMPPMWEISALMTFAQACSMLLFSNIEDSASQHHRISIPIVADIMETASCAHTCTYKNVNIKNQFGRSSECRVPHNRSLARWHKRIILRG